MLRQPASSPVPLPAAATALQLLLALAGAAIAVLLFAPALRFVNGYWLQVGMRVATLLSWVWQLVVGICLPCCM